MKSNKSKIALVLISFAALTAIFMSTLSSCGIVTEILRLKGSLIGNDYNITEYDNFGNKVMTIHGDKVDMDAETDEDGNPTSYIDITIDGYDWKHVGSTLIFAQNGVDIITDFEIPEDIYSDGDSMGLIGIDRFINNYKNFFGRKQVILVSSQTGTPIGLFRGDSVNVTIPSDLPKMTLINIDGKLVYVHRANVDIIPTGLFNN